MLKLGQVKYVVNKLRWFSAARNYHTVWVEFDHLTEPVPLMLTDNEMIRAIKRARKNPEDIVGLKDE